MISYFTDWFFELSACDLVILFVLIGFMVIVKVRLGVGSLFEWKKRKKRKKKDGSSKTGNSEQAHERVEIPDDL